MSNPNPHGIRSWSTGDLNAGLQGSGKTGYTLTAPTGWSFVNLTGGTVGLVRNNQGGALTATASANLTMDPDPGSGHP